MAKKKNSYIPKSCTSLPINIAGLFAYLLTTYYLRYTHINSFFAAICGMLALSATIILLEKLFLGKEHRRSSGVNLSKRNETNWRRILIKLLGLYATLAVVALLYWLLPEYSDGSYAEYFRLAKKIAIIIFFGSLPYFYLMDMFMQDPKDSHWHVGMAVLGKWKQVDKHMFKYHALGWMVKAFFLALMFPSLMNNTGLLIDINNKMVPPRENFFFFYDYMTNLIFAIDLVFVSAGYLLTLKIFDSHNRTVEPSVLGWMAALLCYAPFYAGLFEPRYLNYHDNFHWQDMTYKYENFVPVYGTVILLLLGIYVLATVSFGVRFSNLTNRGIITNGPYRFLKHPAYVSKNISWWLMYVPFISGDGIGMAIKHSLLLIGVNLIYYLRAITEERHLSLDPKYVEYATAMNDNSIFRGLYKIMPFLKYDENKYIKDGSFKKLFF